ncbi:MAG TPA: PAS domain-containing protein, partial [bacterium]
TAEKLEEHSLLQAVLNTVPHPLYVKDLEQRVLLVNHATEAMAGLPAKDIVGKDIAVLSRATVLPEEQRRQVQETDEEVMRTGKTVEFVIHRHFPDGQRQMRVTKSPVRNREGKVTGMLLITEDITARLKTEEEIQEQRTLLRTVFDAIPHFLYVKDKDDRFMLINRAMEIFQPEGSPRLVGSRIALGSLRHKDEMARTQEDNRRVIEDGASLDFHRTIDFGPGGLHYVRTIKVPLLNSQGERIGLVGMDENETQRVVAERQVLEQREFLQAILDAIPQDLFVKDKSGKIILVNQAMANRWQKPKEELLGRRGYGVDGVTDEDMRRIEASDRRVLEQGQTHTWVQTLTDASTETHTFRVHKVPLRNAAGEVTGLVMTGEDISALAASEQEAASSRALMRTVLDAIPETVSLKDTSLRYQFINHAAPARFGLSPAELLGKRAEDLALMSQEGKADSRAADEYVLKSGNATTVPLMKWKSLEGGERWERVLKQPVRDESGTVTGI